MKVILVSQNASPGLHIFRKDLIKYMVSCGHEVYCFAIDYTDELRSFIRQLGAIPIDYRMEKTGLNPLRDILDILRLAKIIKKIDADLVFGFFIKPSIYATLAAKLAGVPRRVAMLEGLGYIYTPSKNGFSLKKRVLQVIHGVLSTIGYAFAHKVIFLNKDDPKDLCRFALLRKDKIEVVGAIGLDLDAYPYKPAIVKDNVRFIFVARLLEEKGILDYLEAARLVKIKSPNTEFVVLGALDAGNPASLTFDQLQAVIEENLIIYPGHVNNVSEWIAGSHVFVLPSFYREGVPRSTQEAMATGRAIITTDVPGCRETVHQGKNGFLVSAFRPEALAEKMLYFIARPDEILRMGNESHVIAVENYDVNKISPVLFSMLIGEKR